MTALSVKATMALVAKHTLVVDKVTVEAWVQIPPWCAGEHTKERKLWQQQSTWGGTSIKKSVVAKTDN